MTKTIKTEIAGNLAVQALRTAIIAANLPDHLRPNLMGYFVNALNEQLGGEFAEAFDPEELIKMPAGRLIGALKAAKVHNPLTGYAANSQAAYLLGQEWRRRDLCRIPFEKYKSDGPGYSGVVEFYIQGDKLTQISGNQTMEFQLPVSLPSLLLNSEAFDAQLILPKLSDDDREYLGGGAIDPSRVRSLHFADGKTGFLMLYGEDCYFTLGCGDRVFSFSEGVVTEVEQEDLTFWDKEEGWGVSDVGGGQLQLQRIDDPDESAVHFESDGQAMLFVVHRALRGSVRHQKVLDMFRTRFPQEYERIQEVISHGQEAAAAAAALRPQG